MKEVNELNKVLTAIYKHHNVCFKVQRVDYTHNYYFRLIKVETQRFLFWSKKIEITETNHLNSIIHFSSLEDIETYLTLMYQLPEGFLLEKEVVD